MTTEGDELKLYIDNDGTLYRQRLSPIQKNLIKKKKKGIYNSVGATKLFTYLVNDGAKKYAKENAQPSQWNIIFPPKVRLEVAREYEKEFSQMYRDGEFD